MRQLIAKLDGVDDGLSDLVEGMRRQADVVKDTWCGRNTHDKKEVELMDLAETFFETLRTAEAMVTMANKKRKRQSETDGPEEINSSSSEAEQAASSDSRIF